MNIVEAKNEANSGSDERVRQDEDEDDDRREECRDWRVLDGQGAMLAKRTGAHQDSGQCSVQTTKAGSGATDRKQKERTGKTGNTIVRWCF